MSYQMRSSSVQQTDHRLEHPNYAPASTGIGGMGAMGGKRSMPSHPSESPAKKQSKWSAEEDALIIDLRGGGMKWEDISKKLPGRSAISCRLHYQNYLERRSEWDEERKNKLARLYERFKPEMWSKVAEEMAVPWRAAEAMHWQLGEADMARRAGVVPFSLSSSSIDTSPQQQRTSPPHGHSHSQSHSSMLSSSGSSTSRYSRPNTAQSHARGSSGGSSSRSMVAGRESTPRSVPPTSPNGSLALAAIGASTGMGRGMQMLPSVAELTTGMSPYANGPAYTMSAPSPMTNADSTLGPLLPAIGTMGMHPMGPRPMGDGKRRASPGVGSREATRRRQ